MEHLVAGRDDSGVFNHEDYSSLRGPRAMQDTSGNNRPLAGTKFHGAAFKINQKRSFDYKKEFVIVIMFVPVILTLNNADTNYRTIHLA
jgi:hypothetical protein